LFDQLGFDQWGFLPRIAHLDGVERHLVIVGQHLLIA
jgi:phosphinothricin acetyltransferase